MAIGVTWSPETGWIFQMKIWLTWTSVTLAGGSYWTRVCWTTWYGLAAMASEDCTQRSRTAPVFDSSALYSTRIRRWALPASKSSPRIFYHNVFNESYASLGGLNNTKDSKSYIFYQWFSMKKFIEAVRQMKMEKQSDMTILSREERKVLGFQSNRPIFFLTSFG